MIVDCHTHVDMSTGQTGLSEHLAAAETVDACIVLAEPHQAGEKTNSELAEYVARHSRKMVGFAFVDPVHDRGVTRDLAGVTEKLGLRGLALYCCRCGFHPADSRAMQLYEAAQQMALPVFFHNAGPVGADAVLAYAQPMLLDEVAQQLPDLKIIIGNMGAPFVEQTFAMVAKHPNVYGDLTIRPGNVWQTYNTVICAYEHGIMDKLLFGSGFPFATASQCIETLLGFNKLLADTNLPTVPRGSIRAIIERDTLEVLGLAR